MSQLAIKSYLVATKNIESLTQSFRKCGWQIKSPTKVKTNRWFVLKVIITLLIIKCSFVTAQCETEFNFYKNLQDIRQVGVDDVECRGGDETIIDRGQDYVDATGNFAKRLYQLKTANTDSPYTDLYTDTLNRIKIDSSSGKVELRRDVSMVDTNIYVQFCCQYDSSLPYNYTDCKTTPQPLLLKQCNCDKNVVTISRPSNFVQYYEFYPDANNTQPWFIMDQFPTDTPQCISHNYIFYDVTTGARINNIYWDNSTGVWKFKIEFYASMINQFGLYDFNVRLQAQYNHFSWENSTIQLYYACKGINGQASNIITDTLNFTDANSYIDVNLAAAQYVVVGVSTNIFVLPNLTHSVPLCAFDQIQVVSMDGTDTSYQGLQQFAVINPADQLWRVYPTNPNLDDVSYKFKIQGTDKTGQVFTSSHIFTLHVGCPPDAASVVSIDSWPSLIINLDVLKSAMVPFTMDHNYNSILRQNPLFQWPFNNCKIDMQFAQIIPVHFSETGIVDEQNPKLQPNITQSVYSNTCFDYTCSGLDIDSIDYLYKLQFQIEYTVSGNTNQIIKYLWSKIHILQTRCLAPYELIAPEISTYQYMVVGLQKGSSVYFKPFTCLWEDCCIFELDKYEIVYTLNEPDPDIKPIRCCYEKFDEFNNTQIYYMVDVSKAGNYTFTVQATSNIGDVGVSEEITLQIGDLPLFVPPYINQAPNFVTTPICPILYYDPDINYKNQIYRCQVPEITDKEGDEHSQFMVVKGITNYMDYDKQTRTISIDMAKLSVSNLGISPLIFKLKDIVGSEREVFVVILIKRPEIQKTDVKLQQNITAEFNQNQQLGVVDKTPNMSAMIKQVSQIGLMKIDFNQSLQTEGIAKQYINNSVLDIYIKPANDRHLDVDDFNFTALNFTWNTTDILDNQLVLQLYFHDPLSISPNIDQDRIVVNLRNDSFAHLFTSKEFKKTLHRNWWTIDSNIGKQMEASSFNKTYQKRSNMLNDFMVFIIIFSIVLFMITQGGQAMKFMFIMVRSLQLILHLPILRVIFPANVMMIIKVMIPTVCFDVLDQFDIWSNQNILEFDFQKHDQISLKQFTQMVEIGYDSYNTIMLLQTLALLLFMYFLQIVFVAGVLLFSIVTKNEHGCWDKYRRKGKKLFFGPLIELFIQGYFEFLISAILALQIEDHTLFGEQLSQYIAYFSIFMTVVFLPLGSFAIIFINGDSLRRKGFYNRWSQLYSNLNLRYRIDSRGARIFTLIFVLRRMAFVATSFYVVRAAIFQILIITFMQLMMLIYQGSIRPGHDRMSNLFDMFNEMLVLICIDTFIVFTDWVPDLEQQFYLGWQWMGFVLLTMLINLAYIMYLSMRQIRLIAIKYFRILKLKLNQYRFANKQITIAAKDSQNISQGTDSEEQPEQRAVQGQTLKQGNQKEDSGALQKDNKQIGQEKEQAPKKKRLDNEKNDYMNDVQMLIDKKITEDQQNKSVKWKGSGSNVDFLKSFNRYRQIKALKVKQNQINNNAANRIGLPKKDQKKVKSVKFEIQDVDQQEPVSMHNIEPAEAFSDNINFQKVNNNKKFKPGPLYPSQNQQKNIRRDKLKLVEKKDKNLLQVKVENNKRVKKTIERKKNSKQNQPMDVDTMPEIPKLRAADLKKIQKQLEQDILNF